jgi:hypothetical protein
MLLSPGTQPTRLNLSHAGWVPVPAQTTRSLYRAADWLAAAPETQMHLIHGTLRGWEELADAIEAQEPEGDRLPARDREMLRLLECVRIAPALTPEQVRQAIQAYAAQHRDAVFTTFGDLAGRALDRRCPAPPAG